MGLEPMIFRLRRARPKLISPVNCSALAPGYWATHRRRRRRRATLHVRLLLAPAASARGGARRAAQPAQLAVQGLRLHRRRVGLPALRSRRLRPAGQPPGARRWALAAPLPHVWARVRHRRREQGHPLLRVRRLGPLRRAVARHAACRAGGARAAGAGGGGGRGSGRAARAAGGAAAARLHRTAQPGQHVLHELGAAGAGRAPCSSATSTRPPLHAAPCSSPPFAAAAGALALRWLPLLLPRLHQARGAPRLRARQDPAPDHRGAQGASRGQAEAGAGKRARRSSTQPPAATRSRARPHAASPPCSAGCPCAAPPPRTTRTTTLRPDLRAISQLEISAELHSLLRVCWSGQE